MPIIETVSANMNHYRTKKISVSRVSLSNLVPALSTYQHINMLIHTKDILCVSAFHKVSIMTRGINVQCSVTPVSLMYGVP